MKALTLYQPWASLIAAKVKTIETRSWRPPESLIGQRLAIHAGKTIGQWNVRSPDGREMLAKVRNLWGLQWWEELPRGAVVATAELVLVERVKLWQPGDALAYLEGEELAAIRVDAYGDFATGRYLWHLGDIQPLEPPVAAQGRQGLWNWTPHQ